MHNHEHRPGDTRSSSPPRYDYRLDLSDDNLSHTKLMKWVGQSKKVLEIGCATGYLTRHMKESLNCRVWCIEIDPAAAQVAEPYAEQMVVGDIESNELLDLLNEKTFDTILLADVIEHLKSPENLLSTLTGRLSADGCLLLSVPNATHGAIALEMLDGNWDYRDIGLLDRTHLRFFDKKNLLDLMDRAGYAVTRLDRCIIHPRDTEFRTRWEAYPKEVTAYIEQANPEFRTYQFILKAHAVSGARQPIDSTDEAGITGQGDTVSAESMERLHAEIDRLKNENSVLADHLAKTATDGAGALREQQRRHDAEKAAMQQAGQQRLTEATEKIEALEAELHAYRSQEKPALMARISALQHEIDTIRSTFLWRAMSAYRDRVERMLPPGSRRREGYRLLVRGLEIRADEGFSGVGRRIAGRLRPLFVKSVGAHADGVDETAEAISGPAEENVLTDTPEAPPATPPAERPASDEADGLLRFPNVTDPAVSIVIPVYNQWAFTRRCLLSLMRVPAGAAFEIIVADNGSTDETPAALAEIPGIRILRNEENRGFVDACNAAAAMARGRFLLFLNNDTEMVTEQWLEKLLKPFERESVGIAGVKLVYPDGRLQEAGGIIFQDASGWNYGNGDDPDKPEYSYFKSVDYCSGACLMIRRALWEKLGGFDARFSPAYYEDTDLCFAARQTGHDVVFQPAVRVIHHEGATAGTDITAGFKKYQAVNLEKFKSKWERVLKRDHAAGPADLFIARERNTGKRIMVVDRFAPTFDQDSGSFRMFQILKLLREMGHKVVFWPEDPTYHSVYSGALQEMGVEVLFGDLDFEAYLKEYGRFLDWILLSRPSTAIRYLYAARTLSRAKILYDTVDLHYVREARRTRMEIESRVQDMKRLELFLARQSDRTLVVSPEEKALLAEEGLEDRVKVLSNIHPPVSSTVGFREREGLMFIGGFAHHPNEDGIVWFVRDILPLIEWKIGPVPLRIVGSRPGPAVQALASERIEVTGYVPDVAPFFERARVFVSPLRYGAGVKGKVGQSLSFGLPVVSTGIGAEGMKLVHGETAMIADGETGFAECVAQLYTDQRLWEKLALQGRQLIENRFAPAVMKARLNAILTA